MGPRRKLLYFPLTSTSEHTWSDSLLIPGLKFREIFHDFPVTFSYCLRLIFRYKKVHVCVSAKLLQACLTVQLHGLYVAHQAPLSMGFSRQEYWSGLPCPPAGDLPCPGIEPGSPALAGRYFSISATWEACKKVHPKLTHLPSLIQPWLLSLAQDGREHAQPTPSPEGLWAFRPPQHLQQMKHAHPKAPGTDGLPSLKGTARRSPGCQCVLQEDSTYSTYPFQVEPVF